MGCLGASVTLQDIVFMCTVILVGSAADGSDIVLKIIPSGTIVRHADEDLNLTCLVRSQSKQNRYSLTWNLPSKSSSEGSRVSVFKTFNELTVTVHHLQEADSGQYVCEVSGNGLSLRHAVRVIVKSGKKKCFDSLFHCGNGVCISRRYICDGKPDCSEGTDESYSICGQDPCEGKFLCDDGRCIPSNMCCDPTANPDCHLLYIMPCCQKFLKTASAKSPSSTSSHGHDITFLQSTIYTIVSCVTVFIFISTITVVAICRFHMRRSLMTLSSVDHHQTANRRGLLWARCHRMNTHHHIRNSQLYCANPGATASDQPIEAATCLTQLIPSLPPYNIPHSSSSSSASSHGSFVVTFSGGDTVSFLRHYPKPPSYTEAMLNTVSTGPPPPYSSTEEIHPSLSDECPPMEDCQSDAQQSQGDRNCPISNEQLQQ